MMRSRAWMLLLTAVLLSPGCLIGETAHVLYLDPDGAVTWTVRESVMRSDAEEPADRRREEAEYLEQAWVGVQPVAQALAWLGPVDLRTEVTRPWRPFTVFSEARFPAVDRLAVDFMTGLGAIAEASLVDDGEVMRLDLIVQGLEAEEDDDEEDVLLSLVGDADDYRIVLTSGRFIDAEGFEISDDGAVAVPDENACPDEGDRCALSLSWAAR